MSVAEVSADSHGSRSVRAGCEGEGEGEGRLEEADRSLLQTEIIFEN